MPVSPDKVLFRNVSILDSTGANPYSGDVLVENDRIAAIGTVDPHAAAGARVIEGRGRTLMSGLCDAHTHFSWNNSADLDGLGTMPPEDTSFSDEECAAAVTEAHRRGKRVCAHARSAESVKMCVRNHVDIIYHASFTDAEGMDMLEANKDWVFVAPGINWLIATLYEAQAFGFPQEAAEAVGYKKELEMAEARLREMHRRGVRVLPGRDYGLAWTPHRSYARDLP